MSPILALLSLVSGHASTLMDPTIEREAPPNPTCDAALSDSSYFSLLPADVRRYFNVLLADVMWRAHGTFSTAATYQRFEQSFLKRAVFESMDTLIYCPYARREEKNDCATVLFRSSGPSKHQRINGRLLAVLPPALGLSDQPMLLLQSWDYCSLSVHDAISGKVLAYRSASQRPPWGMCGAVLRARDSTRFISPCWARVGHSLHRLPLMQEPLAIPKPALTEQTIRPFGEVGRERLAYISRRDMERDMESDDDDNVLDMYQVHVWDLRSGERVLVLPEASEYFICSQLGVAVAINSTKGSSLYSMHDGLLLLDKLQCTRVLYEARGYLWLAVNGYTCVGEYDVAKHTFIKFKPWQNSKRPTEEVLIDDAPSADGVIVCRQMPMSYLYHLPSKEGAWVDQPDALVLDVCYYSHAFFFALSTKEKLDVQMVGTYLEAIPRSLLRQPFSLPQNVQPRLRFILECGGGLPMVLVGDKLLRLEYPEWKTL